MGPFTLPAMVLALAIQAEPASITGYVRSEARAPLEGAEVRLGELDRAVLTGPDGAYRLSAVPAGPQHLTVSYLGHASRTVHALVPGAGSLRLDVTLAVEPIPLGGIEVVRARPPGATPPHATGVGERRLSASEIRAHPLLAEPDALEALVGGPVTADPEAPTGVHIRGSPSDHTAYLLDGLPVFGAFHAGGLFSAWSTEALADVAVHSTHPVAGLPEALAGVVEGRVRSPGSRFGSEVELSTSHGGLTAHGPLPASDAGYVVALRSAFPGTFAPGADGTYLTGEMGDALVSVAARALGGEGRFLLFDSESDLALPASVDPSDPSVAPGPGHVLEWRTRTVGATWDRGTPTEGLRLSVWRATAGSDGTWVEPPGLRRLESRSGDAGLSGLLRRADATGRWEAALKASRLVSRYGGSFSGEAPSAEAQTLPLAAATLVHASDLGPFELRVGSTVTSISTGLYWSPRGEVTWRPSGRWSASVSMGRAHQYTQSMRNPESVASRVYGADPAVVAGRGGVPVPRSDQWVAATAWAPRPWLRLGLEAYDRRTADVVLVAPLEPGPFADGSFLVGSHSARGASVEATGNSTRVSWTAGYGLERTRVAWTGGSYAPEHAASHRVDAGVAVHPGATWTLRVGMKGLFGRFATDVGGGFEWEACNLLDRGCEFAGTPTLEGPLGARRLASYMRTDFGAQKHWHVRVAGRESTVTAYGTVTNVLGRRNTLLFARDPSTGEAAPVDMRPRAPLVVGLTWRF